MTISRNELIAIINTAYDAVNASKAGPITMEDETGQTVLQVGYNTFLCVVAKLVQPCVMSADMDITEKKMDETIQERKVTSI